MDNRETNLTNPHKLKDVIKDSYSKAPNGKKSYFSVERPVPPVYATIDTDLGRDNLENDIPAADIQDL